MYEPQVAPAVVNQCEKTVQQQQLVMQTLIIAALISRASMSTGIGLIKRFIQVPI